MSKLLNLQRLVLAIAAFVVIAVASVAASADSVTLTTLPGATNSTGSPVNASVTLTVNPAGTLTITLTNHLVNQVDVGQNISDLGFHSSTAVLAGFSSNASFVNVAADGTPSSAGSGFTGWSLSEAFGGPTGGSDFELSVLGTATAPAHTILGAPGPSGYTNANGSIAGNNPHNPFINQTATFTLTGISGLTSVSQLSNITISFGTTAGDNVPVTNVPEPTTMLLLGTGLLGVAGAARRRFIKN